MINRTRNKYKKFKGKDANDGRNYLRRSMGM